MAPGVVLDKLPELLPTMDIFPGQLFLGDIRVHLRRHGSHELDPAYYCFQILTRCFWARHRTQKRRPATVDLDDTPDLFLYSRSAAAGLPWEGEDPASQLIERLGTERVVAAIAQLPEEYGVVCTLYFMEDFAYHEIAEVLGIPVGTVRSRLHRGRKMLQKVLWQIAEESGIVTELARGGDA